MKKFAQTIFSYAFSQPVSSTFLSQSNFLYFPECLLTTLREVAEYAEAFEKENSSTGNRVDTEMNQN